jgi:NADH-quinone oxidoreductase subunit L
MYSYLWLIPAFPFIGAALLTLLVGSNSSRRTKAIIGVGSIGVSLIVTLLIAYQFITSPPANYTYTESFWTWINVDGFTPNIAFHLDALSLIMILVVTFVGFLIHMYSAEFMKDEEGFGRFFSYMNLFVGMMLVLLMADNYLLLYLGWEGVGLCSYLLIGFWYKDPANGRAARKAFVVTRVGDVALAIALFLLFDNLGTLQIQEVMQRAVQQWPVGSGLAVAAAFLLLGGAVGKSAQLPLQTWLPDAMAGPTPVSALIHAATMVTAGVYLIARSHVLFSLAPSAMTATAIIGALTLLLAGFSGLTQWDIKRVLAYSTMSQIGYMFLALGVGAWPAAIFHFMNHAFFKALLFLGAGVIITRLHHEHNMFKMGGLRKELPLTFWTFLIASGSLAALPLITAGFYSKDKILYDTWASAQGGPWLWAAGLVGALLTSLYTFRMVFLTFFGEPKQLVKENSPLEQPNYLMTIPLVSLAILSIAGGFLELPSTLGNLPLFSDFIHSTLPPLQIAHASVSTEAILETISGLVALIGVYIAYYFTLRRPQLTTEMVQAGLGNTLHHFWFVGWGFDWLYSKLFIQPFVFASERDKNDFIDAIYDWLANMNVNFSQLLRQIENGQLRWYVLVIFFGAVIMIVAMEIL